MRVLELFCGLGGCAAALHGSPAAQIVAAIDVHPGALAAYQHSFPDHPTINAEIAFLGSQRLRAFQADLWWMSPPCQPFTRRGLGRGLEDRRCRALRFLIKHIDEIRPPHIALENVPDFVDSDAHELLRETLLRAGYEVREWLLCPSELGVPNRRRRFYLLASLEGLRPEKPLPQFSRPLYDFIDQEAHKDPLLRLDEAVYSAYHHALHIIGPGDYNAVTNCFTSAYGRSHVRSGSYLSLGQGYRRFAPREILRLLGFPPGYDLPPLPPRRAWPLVGNSLSLFCVKHVLHHLQGFDL